MQLLHFFGLLKIGLFLILRALSAYLKVFNVSSIFESAEQTQAIIKVCELPPNESCIKRVNLISRYVTCLGLFDGLSSLKALMTLPKANKPKLMFIPSLKRKP